VVKQSFVISPKRGVSEASRFARGLREAIGHGELHDSGKSKAKRFAY
jgi:hypothetical protein